MCVFVIPESTGCYQRPEIGTSSIDDFSSSSASSANLAAALARGAPSKFADFTKLLPWTSSTSTSCLALTLF
jgi:hypothetical protein